VLVNPGFENGTQGWEGRGCKIGAVKSPVHNGTGAAKAFDRTQTWQGIKQSLLGKVVSGSTYKISAWARLENSAGDAVIMSIEVNDGSGATYSNINNTTAVKDEWVQLTGEYTPNAVGTLKTLDLYFEGPMADVNFFVDDVVFYGAAAGKTEPNAPKTEPNAPKDEPNMPKEGAKAQTSQPQAGTIAELATRNTISAKYEAVLNERVDR
jgi:endo-1,4-beta-xylanase